MRLHFSIGGYDYRTVRFRQGIHFSIIQVLFADHVHWRTGVDNKFSFLKFKIWCRRTYFPKVKRMLLFLVLSIFTHLWSVGATQMGWRAIAFVNFTRWVGFCMSELFREIEVNFGGPMSWKTQPNCSAYSMICTQQVRDSTHDGCHALQRVATFYHDFCHGSQNVALFYHASHTSSTWLRHFCHHSF